MQQHPLQPHMGSYPAHNVTTEIIQKYLDENKQLILAILDNQNLGKLNECAAYQARLQANLMYLAAIADSQPQPSPVHAQVPQAAVMQTGLHYMAHQQAQQQMAQQSLMAARNPLQYTQQSISSLHHSQQQHQHQQHQAMSAAHVMHSGANNSLTGIPSEPGLGGNSSFSSGGYPDFGRGGNTGDGLQISRGLGGEIRAGSKSDVVSVTDAGHGTSGGGNGGTGAGHVGDEPETSYLKGSEEEGN